MPRPAALLMLPSHPRAGVEKDGFRTSSSLLAQSLDDLHLAERVVRALRVIGYGPLRDIDVTVQARLVILRGRVPSYHLKQVGEATALCVPGIDQVRNDLEVGRPS